MTDVVFKLDPDEDDLKELVDGIVDHNATASGRHHGYRRFAFLLVDPEEKRPVGGLSGWSDFDWVFVHLLFVPQKLRGKGHGRALINRAEQFAREQGCVGMWLDTFSFQARPFYEKLGFVVFGTLDDHPRGGARYFMQKRFTPS
jgi:GNAT superfamily N-acetyltransferase